MWGGKKKSHGGCHSDSESMLTPNFRKLMEAFSSALANGYALGSTSLSSSCTSSYPPSFKHTM